MLPEQVDRIAGTRRSPAGELGGWLCDPNTGRRLQPRLATGPAALEEALAAVAAVHAREGWAGLGVAGRAAALEDAAVALEAVVEAVALADSLNTGVPIAVTRLVAASLAGSFREAIAQLRSGWTCTRLPGPVSDVELHRLPWGPAAILVPWNAPTAIAAGKVANALAAGCPAILKAPEWAPSGCNLLADAIEAASLPPGVFQLVHGGPEVGAALVSDPRVRAVSFTGGLAAGRAVAHAAVADFKALQLELGGNNPALVRADADVELAAEGLASGLAKLNGQWCEAPGKILAASSVAEPLVEALLARLGELAIGSSLEAATELGPLAHRARRDRLEGQLAALASAGGRVRRAGRLPPLGGWFFAPALVTGLAPERCAEELFGPAATVHPVSDDEEAIALANAAPDGLAAYVFSSDAEAALAVGRRLRFGEVKINGTSVLDLAPGSTQSFWRLSGLGGHGAAEGFRFFCGSQIVGVDHPKAPL